MLLTFIASYDSFWAFVGGGWLKPQARGSSQPIPRLTEPPVVER